MKRESLNDAVSLTKGLESAEREITYFENCDARSLGVGNSQFWGSDAEAVRLVALNRLRLRKKRIEIKLRNLGVSI